LFNWVSLVVACCGRPHPHAGDIVPPPLSKWAIGILAKGTGGLRCYAMAAMRPARC